MLSYCNTFRLNDLFGSNERFFEEWIRTSTGEKLLKSYLTGEREKMDQEVKKVRRVCQLEYANAMQQHMEQVSMTVNKFIGMSNHTYQKLRETNLEPRQVSEARV